MTNYFVKNKLNDEEKITKEYKTKSSIYTIVAWIVLIICGWGIINSFEKWSIASWWLIILAVCSVIVILLQGSFAVIVDRIVKQYSEIISKMSDELDSSKKSIRKLEVEKQSLISSHERKENLFKLTINSKTPFQTVSSMFADWQTSVFVEAESFLKSKQRPAIKAAETISEFREIKNRATRERKEMEYKYLFLLKTFPELKQYIYDEEALLHLGDYKDFEEFKEERDEVLEYVNPEEYKAMSEIERNQLALDRFKSGKKTDWQIGMLYEMYIGHLLRKNQFTVTQYGIEHGLQDLGRDIIAQRVENGVRKIYIIQCKNWSKKKMVHENVVCQLYGTSVQYELANKDLAFQKTEVIPWLVITNELSDMAQKFAEKLGVLVSVRKMDYSFPMIKCNINNGNKIYHLPFDQQYYRTQIKLPGECYVSTVKEAIDKGFRRARRHMYES